MELAPRHAGDLELEPVQDTHTAKLLRDWGIDTEISRRELVRRMAPGPGRVSRQTIDNLMRPRRPGEQRRVTRETLTAVADAMGKPVRPLQQAVIADWHPDQEVTGSDGVSDLMEQLRQLDRVQRRNVLSALLQLVTEEEQEE